MSLCLRGSTLNRPEPRSAAHARRLPLLTANARQNSKVRKTRGRKREYLEHLWIARTPSRFYIGRSLKGLRIFKLRPTRGFGRYERPSGTETGRYGGVCFIG